MAIDPRLTGFRRRLVVLPKRAPRRRPWVLVGGDVLALGIVVAAGQRHTAPLVGLTFAVLAIGMIGSLGLYGRQLAPTVVRDVGAVALSLAVAMIGAAMVAAMTGAGSRLGALGVTALVLVLVVRLFTYRLVRWVRVRSARGEPTLILGAGSVGVELARVLHDHPEYGLDPIGFLDDFAPFDATAPLLGDVRSLPTIMTEQQVARVIVAFGGTAEADMIGILRACDRPGVEIHVVPRFFDLGAGVAGRLADSIWGIPVVRLPRRVRRSRAWQAKRVMDCVGATVGLTVSAVPMAVIAAAIKLTSRGPVFFKQSRVGQDGCTITVLKFRTMCLHDESDTLWSADGDERVTRVGRVLRRTSLDELPQLWNVLRGEMSLVGPRPERHHFVARFEAEVAHYGDRHRVPGGLTGWAQIHGLRGDSSIAQRARFDNNYIEHWSVGMDLRILAGTLRAVLCQAFKGEHWNVERNRGESLMGLTARRLTVLDLTDDAVAAAEQPAERAV